MSVFSAASSQQENESSSAIIQSALPPSMSEMAQLSDAIQEWRRINTELIEMKQTVKERTKRVKILEEIIMRIMKKNNIQALTMKSSKGRLLYSKKKRPGSLSQKNMAKLLTDHFGSETKAAELLAFLSTNRGTKVAEKLEFEKDVDE